MSSLQVVNFIKEFGIEELKKQFGIVVNENYEDRIVLNYSQIDSPKHHPITKECRGLILSLPDYYILSRSFDRFFNFNEDPETKNFDISKCIVETKEDGTLINLYFDGSLSWNFSTRKMAFAEGWNTFGSDVFHNMCIHVIHDVMDLNGNDFINGLDIDCTYIFELTSPHNRVVKQYDDYRLTHLATRNKFTGKYIEKKLEGFPVPKEYNFKNEKELFDSLSELPALDEGYVCRIDDWRIKVKNPSYLAISNLRENGKISEKRICYLVCQNDYGEYLSYFPDDLPLFQPYIDKFNNIINEINVLWNEVKDIQDQKEFAMKVKDKHYGFVLFQLRKNPDTTVSEILSNMTDVKCQGFVCNGK